MQTGRSDLRKRGCWSRSSSHTSRREGERSRALLGGFLAMSLLVGGVGWPVCSPAADGDLKWAYPTGGSLPSSPAIAPNGTIYVGSVNGKLHAIDPNGTFKWAFTTGDFVYSSPAIAPDGTIYVGSRDHKLYAIRPNGTRKWSYTTGDYVWSSPALAADGKIGRAHV